MGRLVATNTRELNGFLACLSGAVCRTACRFCTDVLKCSRLECRLPCPGAGQKRGLGGIGGAEDASDSGEEAEAEGAVDYGTAGSFADYPFTEECGGGAPAPWEVALFALVIIC